MWFILCRTINIWTNFFLPMYQQAGRLSVWLVWQFRTEHKKSNSWIFLVLNNKETAFKSYLSLGLRDRNQYSTTVAHIPKDTLQPIGLAQFAGLPSVRAWTPPLPPLCSSPISQGSRWGSQGLMGSRGSLPVGWVRYAGLAKFTAESTRRRKICD